MAEKQIYLMQTRIGFDITFDKIGVSNTPEARRSDLQRGNPIKLELLTTIKADDPYRIESDLIDVFKLNGCHVRREWFDLPDEVLQKLVNMDWITADDCNALFDGGRR